MKRQVLTDGSGRWFNLESAEQFEEAVRWNGSNNISLATGSQWEHETLYRTAGRRWILHAWSQRQGTRETWEEIDDEAAAKWLVTNGHEHDAVADEIADLEIK